MISTERTIKINWSAEECDPWTTECKIRGIDDDNKTIWIRTTDPAILTDVNGIAACPYNERSNYFKVPLKPHIEKANNFAWINFADVNEIPSIGEYKIRYYDFDKIDPDNTIRAEKTYRDSSPTETDGRWMAENDFMTLCLGFRKMADLAGGAYDCVTLNDDGSQRMRYRVWKDGKWIREICIFLDTTELPF